MSVTFRRSHHGITLAPMRVEASHAGASAEPWPGRSKREAGSRLTGSSWSRRGATGFGNEARTEQAKPVRRAKVERGRRQRGAGARDRVVGPSGARANAEEARWRMAAAKRAAEKVAAGFFANQRFTTAQSKERDGIVALGQSDYRAAIRLLVEAHSEYQAAVPGGQVGGTERPPARSPEGQPRTGARGGGSEAARSPCSAGRGSRERRLRPSAGQAGRGRRVGGCGRDLVAAARAYQEAAERYGEATLRARAARASWPAASGRSRASEGRVGRIPPIAGALPTAPSLRG